MTKHSKRVPDVIPLNLRELQLILADELDFVSDDDVANAPDDKISAWLGAIDADAQIESVRHSIDSAAPTSSTDPGPVPRRALAGRVLNAVRIHSVVVLTGAAGSGKSFFLHNLFCTTREVRGHFPQCVTIDCAALRTRSAATFEREAVWALFGSNDDAFRRFWSSRRQADPPVLDFLKKVLASRLPSGGILIFDHFGCLEDRVRLLIKDKILPFAKDHNIKLIFCGRSEGALPRFLHGHEAARVHVDHISTQEIEGWLEQKFFTPHVEAGISANRLFRLTGGSPSLLKSFGNWLVSQNGTATPPLGRAALLKFSKQFTKWRANDGYEHDNFYLMDCERLFQAARRRPLALFAGLRKLTGLGRANIDVSIPEEDYETLISTGAVRCVERIEGPGDKKRKVLEFTSPIHARRAKLLSQPVNMARLLFDADIRQLAESDQLSLMRRHTELASDPVGRWLVAERNPQDALKRLKEVLNAWGAEVAFLLRDRDNARLWMLAPKEQRKLKLDSGFGGPDFWADLMHFQGASPLSAHNMPDLARAAQTGQPVLSDEGRIYVPLNGNSGLVEMIVVARFKRSFDAYRLGIELDKLVGLLRGMRPTLALVLESFALRRERQGRKRLIYRSHAAEDSDTWQPIFATLRQTECSELAVLERSRTEWVLGRHESFQPISERLWRSELDTADWMEGASTARLDAIAEHPSGRGVVLADNDVAITFPALSGRDKDLALFLRPVRTQRGRLCRIVVFAFDGQASRSLYGNVQSCLSVVAPDIAAASG